MKKTLISISLLAAMSVAGTAQAWTDAPSNTAGHGEVIFTGTIDNNTPIWAYELADSLKFQGSVFNASHGTKNGNVTEFDLGNKDIALLRGVTKNPIAKGRPGLQPQIVFGSGENAINWDTSAGKLPESTLSMDALRDGAVIGNVIMKLDGQVASNRKTPGNNYHAGGQFGAVPLAAKLLHSQPWYEKAYAEGRPMQANQSLLQSTGEFTDRNMHTISAAIYVRGLDFKLALNNETLAGEWSAQLPITITQK